MLARSDSYLKNACMHYKKEDFTEDCEELEALRLLSREYLSEEDRRHYEEVSPVIVNILEGAEEKDLIYDYIYLGVITPAVVEIKRYNFLFACDRLKHNLDNLEEAYARCEYQKRLVNALRKKGKSN